MPAWLRGVETEDSTTLRNTIVFGEFGPLWSSRSSQGSEWNNDCWLELSITNIRCSCGCGCAMLLVNGSLERPSQEGSYSQFPEAVCGQPLMICCICRSPLELDSLSVSQKDSAWHSPRGTNVYPHDRYQSMDRYLLLVNILGHQVIGYQSEI